MSAATPEATAAGLEVLELGGNAVDAAISVGFVLGVTEPAGSGIGGQAIVLLQRPGGAALVVNGTSRAPGKLPESVSGQDLTGRRATTVPSMVRAMDHAYRRFGSGRVSWSRLLEPAVRCAEKGFRLGPFRRHSVARYARHLRQDEAAAALYLDRERRAPAAGALVVQPALGRTLRRIGEAGAVDFYRGDIARRIADDMAKHGGWIRYEDLATFPEPAVVPALHGTYRGHDVYSLPPPAGGWVVLLGLNVLEQAPAAELAAGSTRRPVWMAEALRAAHDARAERPVRDLVEYGAEIERKLGKERARRIVADMESGGRGETTHFVVVDAEGMAVSVSMSLNAYFGARVVHPTLGFLYNDYMREFELGSAEHPFALRARGLPYSSMSATIVAKDGRPILALGSPGSRRIISAVVQVLSNVVDARMAVRDAVAAPRMHVVAGDDALMFELRPTDRPLLLELERRGFEVAVPLSSLFKGRLNPYFGGVHALALQQGRWGGGADPRRDGSVGHAAATGRAAR